jgi:hypothetical protein
LDNKSINYIPAYFQHTGSTEQALEHIKMISQMVWVFTKPGILGYHKREWLDKIHLHTSASGKKRCNITYIPALQNGGHFQ